MADKDTFLTNNKKDFKWPYPKPLSARPAQPPVNTKPKNFYVKEPVEAYCHCDGHLYDPEMNKYEQLAQKEKLLQMDLAGLQSEMALLGNGILEHPCDTYDEKMETIMQTDYVKRGMNLTQYVKLMPAVDSPTGVPVKSQSIGLRNGYRDPTRFRYSCFNRPHIEPCPDTTFKTTPETVDAWFDINTGRSEYQDVFSKTGLSIMKSRQQYAEPLPSSRRRHGETCL